MLEDFFMSSVEQAVTLSIEQNKILVVYNTFGDDRWLDTWFQTELAEEIKPYAVWLKLIKDTEQFGYFEALFPSVVVPSLYLVKQGKVLAVIKDNAAGSSTPSHWEILKETLGVPRSALVTHKGSTKSLREQIVETSQQKYHEEVMKQRNVEREERERILRLVKADRAERQARHQLPVTQSSVKTANIHDNIKDINKIHGKECTLLIRLTNGNTLTKTFDSRANLNDVRAWIDSERTDGDCPYSFHRNIPRTTFTDSEELKSLKDLELPPRSALILKPFDSLNGKMNVTDAKGPGLLGKVFSGISAWWAHDDDPNNIREGGHSDNQSENQYDSPSPQQAADIRSGNQNALPPKAASSSEQRFEDLENSSKPVTPVQSASDSHIKYSTSELSLPSRCVTPNVHQFVNKEDEDKEHSTYNGNNTNLGAKPDDN